MELVYLWHATCIIGIMITQWLAVMGSTENPYACRGSKAKVFFTRNLKDIRLLLYMTRCFRVSYTSLPVRQSSELNAGAEY